MKKKERKKYLKFLKFGEYKVQTTGFRTAFLDRLEILEVLISLQLDSQLNLPNRPKGTHKDVFSLFNKELIRVYLANLELTRYIRPPIFHFTPDRIMFYYGTLKDIPTNYQLIRSEARSRANMTSPVELPHNTEIKQLNLSPLLITQNTYSFVSRRFTPQQWITFQEEKGGIYEQEYKDVKDAVSLNKVSQIVVSRMYEETYIGRILKSIKDYSSYPQVPLSTTTYSYKRIRINGVEFMSSDLLGIFFDTPLASVASELNEVSLTSFPYADLKLIRDYLMGLKTFTGLYRGLSTSAYNQLSAYGSLLSAYELSDLRRIFCEIFVLGLPVIEQIRSNKNKMLMKLEREAYEYLLQRIQMI